MNKQNKTNTENICKAEWTVLDAQSIPNGREIQKAGQFETVGSGAISEEEKRERRAAGALDVGVTKVECVSVSGDTLPAEFALTYRFHLANFSETDLDKVPVTIYFNTPDHAPVEQGRTTVTGIKAGHYQLVQFTFPPVKAGKWTMTLEANQPRAFEESNYANNACAKTFSYVNRAELVADKVKALADNPQYDSDGNQILFYDMETVLEFTMSNIGSQAANGVMLQVPAAFQDATGSYSSMLTEGKIDLPAHTQRKVQLKITFTKPATAQIGLLLNNDKGCQEISYDNNETHETFSIMKYNPGTGPEKAIDIDLSNPDDVSQIPGRMAMPLYLQNHKETWTGLTKGSVSDFMASGCGVCSLAMIISYMNGKESTAVDIANSNLINEYAGVASWDISGKCAGYNLSGEISLREDGFTDEVAQRMIDELVVNNRPILYRATGSDGLHFMVISGYEFDPDKVGTQGYEDDPYGLSHFRVMDPYDDLYTGAVEGRCQTLADVHRKGHYETPLYYKLVVDAN